MAAASELETLQQQAHARRLAEDRYWQLLLHYHRDLLGRRHSDINDQRFFFSDKGRKDPAAELDATLAAFFQPAPADPNEQPAACRFPARFAWLKEHLAWGAAVPAPACPRFDKWREQMDPGSVSLIFASYYLNNPASMYGHTFLRLNGRGRRDTQRLLDYTVNFAAEQDTSNGILFAVRGLTGGYPGQFSTLPYYLKVQQYNNLDFRDLWEYQLQLSTAAVQRLTRHLWEMGQASMPYYFLNKNCSYQLLPLIEVADPALHLEDPFVFKAIPIDTLRAVIHQPGLLGRVDYRPSHVTRMLAARSQLNSGEVALAERLARSADDLTLAGLGGFPIERQARILDSAYDLFRYRVGFRRDAPANVQAQEERLLLARNRLGSGGEKPESLATGVQAPAGTVSPDHGHPTGRVALGFGMTKHSTFEELSGRPAIHDLEDPSPGYIAGSQLQMFNLRLRYDNDRERTYVEDFTLIDIFSLSPWDRWVRKPSWGVRTGVSVAHDRDKAPDKSVYYGLGGVSGLAWESHRFRKLLIYTLAKADSGVGGVFYQNYRIGGGANGGATLEALPWWQIHFNADYLYYPLGETGEVVRLELMNTFPIGRVFQVRAGLKRENNYKEALFSVLRYF